jgi:hypothetical protein
MIKKINLSGSLFSFSTGWLLIIFFAVAKLLIHLFTYSNFELHRDAYLYYAYSENLAWGYVAVPPSIAVVAKLATLILGNTTFALRFFPAVIGGMNLIIIGLAVKKLGGKNIAIILVSLAYLLSTSYLHTNALFQPVCFNHFYWLMSGYLILLMVKQDNPKMWLWIAIVFGLGFLNKYSIVFLYTAFAVSLLISKYRYLYLSKYFVTGLVIGAVIILPNIIWQYRHNWPVMHHLGELYETQLVHVRLSDFIIGQFFMNIQALLIWLVAVIVLLFVNNENQFRLFGYLYILIVVLIMLGSGKTYYTLGIYPVLFVFGAYFIEKYIKKYLIYISGFLVISMFVSLYISLPFDGIPITTFEKAVNKGAFRWEDGGYHDIPQDMADMTGWKEIGEKVRDIYLGMDKENRNNCDIFCYHYGQAGAIMFYGKNNNIPQPISFNDSFVFWAPDSLTKYYMIWVHTPLWNNFDPDSLLALNFHKSELRATIDNKYFRENGTRVYLCEYPCEGFKNYYISRIKESKKRYNLLRK